MKPRPPIRIRLLRTLLLTAAVLAVMGVPYWIWTPGSDIRDGRHDRGQNGLWLAHGWLGADEWFIRNNKQSQFGQYRDPESLRKLAALCAANHITDLYPHLCPCDDRGALPATDAAQTERFLDALTPSCRVIPWIGGPGAFPAQYPNPQWRAAFCQSVRALLDAHPRLAGVQVNIEPLPSGNPDYLRLLEELRATLPAGKILSVAAYPPPTRWQPTSEVHWDETYFRQVATRVDQLAVMMYDTSIPFPKAYEQLMANWTVEILRWADGKPVLLGLAAYDDEGVGYHHPKVENLPHGLAGIHAGLERAGAPANFQGAAVYSHWEMDDAEWQTWRERVLKTAP
jgi:hypothetical protein